MFKTLLSDKTTPLSILLSYVLHPLSQVDVHFFQGSAQGNRAGVSAFPILVASMIVGQMERTATKTADSGPTDEVKTASVQRNS